jgi:enterochelin esterase-like enzyme
MLSKLGSANSDYGWAILHDVFPLLDSKYPFQKDF